MNTRNWVSNTLSASLLALGLATGASPAFAADYPNFTINENSVPGTSPSGNGALVADRLNGLYTETLTPTFTTPGNGTFVANALFNISAYYNNDVLTPGLLGCALTPCYNMYARFNANGSFSTDASGQINFLATTGAVSLFVDPDQVFGNADDYVVASTNTLLTGEGHFRPGLSSGDFEIVWTAVMLSVPQGSSFFTSPNPFFLTVDANGNFTENPLAGGPISGSANAFFAAPEPGTLLLLGVAALGLGITNRRRRA